jgi:PBP1b-binding outer membrane lipoprotein LpoB
MIDKRLVRSIIFTLISILFLAGCTLPTVTPPPGYNPTGAATITAPVPATAVPVTATSAPNAAAISTANAAQLKAVNKIPVSNVQLLRWSTDGSVLALSTQNQDANGNSIFSATLLDGQTLVTKTVFSPTDGTIKDISSDGKLVAVVSNDMTSMAIYDLGDGNKDIVAYTPGYNIQDVTFSPDQKSYAVSMKINGE